MRVYNSSVPAPMMICSGSHVHGPELTQVSSDGPAQGRCAVVWRGAQQLRVLLQDGLAHEPGPHGEGEVGPVQRPGGQVQKTPAPQNIRHQGSGAWGQGLSSGLT